jgi:hypothetical protein
VQRATHPSDTDRRRCPCITSIVQFRNIPDQPYTVLPARCTPKSKSGRRCFGAQLIHELLPASASELEERIADGRAADEGAATLCSRSSRRLCDGPPPLDLGAVWSPPAREDDY